jgi:RsiW-degrading membrane proteinase PrsW (M82 family)
VRHSAPMRRLRARSGIVRGVHAVLAVGAIALSEWQAQLSRDATAAHWCVLGVVVVAIGTALALGHTRQRRTARAWIRKNAAFLRAWRTQPRGVRVSVVVWAVLIGGVVSWDLVSFIFQSHVLPTLSYFIGHVTRYRIGRGIFFALWLGFGAYLVSAQRTESRR